MASSIEWTTHISEDDFPKFSDSTLVLDHPLKTVTVARIPRKVLGSQPSTGRTTPTSTSASLVEPLAQALRQLDPLSELAFQEMDPLSKMAAEFDTLGGDVAGTAGSSSGGEGRNDRFCGMEPWAARKQGILAKYTTSEKLSIVTSFLAEGEKVIVKAHSTAVDKVQHRLEQLDMVEENSRRQLNVTQAEYVNRIEQLNRELVSSWETEQRVKALKIAIQCAKLLSDTDVLQFYPSKFVLVTDILQTFGRLVYERLRTKAEYMKPGSKTPTALPKDFTPDMVPDTAKETCLNWFYKIASIRELVPRLYVELALLRCYNFISTNECSEGLLRISDMINGIGNPLVAVYARCYLVRVGIEVSDRNSNYSFLIANFNGFRDTYQHMFSKGVREQLKLQKMSLSTYFTLYTPALNYILEAVACQVNDSYLMELLDVCKQHKNSSLLLNTVMSAFKPNLISERAMDLLELIESGSEDEGVPLHSLLRTLGLCVNLYPPPSEDRRPILKSVWSKMNTFKDTSEYISCVEAWIQFVTQNFTSRELNAILGNLLAHMSPNRNYENHYNELKMIIHKIVSNVQDIEMLLAMDNFLPLVDLFHQESVKVEVCKNILTYNSNDQKTNDPVIVNALIFLCTILHDSVDALIPEDEYKQIGEIICGVVRRIDYGKDFEQQLNFYVEARGAFSNIDTVLAELVQQVNTLSVKTTQLVKGIHTRKTGDFVRACAAYCFITIPSIISEKTRLELYLLSGRVALYNQCLGQADSCLRAALTLLSDLRETSETFLVPYVRHFLSALLVVPDNQERGVLSLLRALLNVIKEIDWSDENGTLGSLYVTVLDLLTAMAQEEYPYHVDRVESNDALYGSDPKFISEVNKMCSIVLEQVLAALKELGSCRRQSQLAVDLFNRIVTRGDLDNPQLAVLAVKLWQLAVKNGHADVKYMVATREHLKSSERLKRHGDLMESLVV